MQAGLWSSGLNFSIILLPSLLLASSSGARLRLEAFEMHMWLWSRRKSPGKQFAANTQLLKNIYIC